MRHTISLLLENKPGVLSRVAGLFSGRGFNIESLSVAETLDPTGLNQGHRYGRYPLRGFKYYRYL